MKNAWRANADGSDAQKSANTMNVLRIAPMNANELLMIRY